MVENQYEFNIAIKNQLELLSNDSWNEIFYEDFIKNPTQIMANICAFLECPEKSSNTLVDLIKTEDVNLPSGDADDIDLYIHENAERLNFIRQNN